MEFPVLQFVPFASWPITGHHGSIFLAPSYWIFTLIDKNPLNHLFCRLSSPSCVSLSSKERCTSPLVIFVALRWDHSCLSLLYWGAWKWVQPCRCVSPALRERLTFLDLLAMLCLRQVRMPLGFCAVREPAYSHLERDLPKKQHKKRNKTPMFAQMMGLEEHLQAAREGGQINVLLCNLHTTLTGDDFDSHKNFNSRS